MNYSDSLWHVVRAQALARDSGRCTVSRLLGGACAPGPLHVHHIHAVADGGAPYDLDNLGTTCAAHHPMWEALRGRLVSALMPHEAAPPRCTHRHVSAEARAICERQLARQRTRRSLVAA